MKSKQVPTLNSRLLSFIVSNHRINSHISCRCAFTCHLISILRFQNSANPVEKKVQITTSRPLFSGKHSSLLTRNKRSAGECCLLRTADDQGGPRTNAQLHCNCGNSKMFCDVRQEETITSIKSLSQGSTLSKGLLATGHRLGPQTETFS